jgi:ATP-dependent helicase HrpB
MSFSLPIDERLPELLDVLRHGENAVLVAPPGAGKTTRVPLALLDEEWVGGRRILLLEPRRLAARAAAERMAKTVGEEVGATIGLRMRLGSKISRKTRIEVVTEGVFTRLILDDPALDGVAAVIFDEYHERSLDADFGLALALDSQSGLREDLRLLAMSATMDGARVAALMRDAAIVASEGRTFPIDTRYMARAVSERVEDAVTRAVLHAVDRERGGVLVFLPGQAEIGRVAAQLEERLAGARAEIDILPLHGGLDIAEQDRAVRNAAAGRRKIVLATAIAETSLTLDDVRIVIDCGMARLPAYEPDTGMTRLETVRVSRASADQRRGRAGRTAPGICYRLWDEAATASLPAFAPPEILNADLSGLLLDCAAWGVGDPSTLAFLDPPPKGALAEARKLLLDLDALDESGGLTGEGRAIRNLPLPPRLARMLIDAASIERRSLATRNAGDMGGRKAADASSGITQIAAETAAVIVERGLGGMSADLGERLQHFALDRGQRAQAMRSLASGWRRTAQAPTGDVDASASIGAAALGARPSPGLLLALAFPERIARARGRNGEYLLANGRAAALEPTDPLARSTFLAVGEMTGRAASSRIRLAATITAAEIEAAFAAHFEDREILVFDKAARALRRRRQRRLGAMLLDDAPLPIEPGEEAARVLAEGAASVGIDKLPWSKELQRLRGRIMFLRKARGDAWPDVSEEALAASAGVWLAPYLAGKTSLDEIGEMELRHGLESLLPFELRRQLDAEAPSHFDAPSGSHLPIDYTQEGATLSVRVQELFGLSEHPRIAGGSAPLVLNLLSPAHRPIQITTDLPGFWRGSWKDVRAQLRGRYPKHPWPEDPLSAAATSGAKPRGKPG